MRADRMILFLALTLVSCQKDGMDPDNGIDYEYGRELQHGKIVLGNRLENPYKTENMTKALASLYPTKAGRVEVESTDLYVRFLPADKDECDVLESLGIELLDHPLDYAIAVDVGFGNDPYTDKTQTIGLAKGPSIGIAPTLDRDFTRELKQIASDNNIPYQHDVMSGRTGTNADSINITGPGVKTALLSLPLRYMHTGCEVINTTDIENTAKLIAAYLLKKEAECNA